MALYRFVSLMLVSTEWYRMTSVNYVLFLVCFAIRSGTHVTTYWKDWWQFTL